MSESATGRAPVRSAPLHCPYCGDEDLRPEGETAWMCAACRRVFSVTLLGLSIPEVTR
ncbi:Insertion element protein [Saccharomonospora iraqiensis]|uniref:Insertion element protein n=1 Tax=Saccharomonospora iraqiensis TaxID=52698 RepID=UPI00041435A8|nr:Insertion element protein [Saccharomonospora iraqiensis]